MGLLTVVLGLACQADGNGSESGDDPGGGTDGADSDGETDGPAGYDEDTARAALANYASLVFASYEDSAATAHSLAQQSATLIQTPSPETLAAARTAWLEAREPYLQTEVYRFYGGPIDDEDGPEGAMNAWPLDEAYIDYVDGVPDAGIVNDPAVTLDASTLLALNEQGGEANVSTGYHAIEFLLWGQDMDDAGPGARPHTDYSMGSDGTATHQDRRGQYLTTVTDLLVEHLDGLVLEWEANAANYRADFLVAPTRDTLARVFTGMLFLTGFETGGERLQAALESGSQEDEHSCFSDNTHRDFIQDIQGMSNVWHGSYTRIDGTVVSGTGLREVVAGVDPGLAAALDDRIAQNLTLAGALHIPYDQEIRLDNPEGRQRIQDLVLSMREQESLLEEVFIALDLSFPEVEDW